MPRNCAGWSCRSNKIIIFADMASNTRFTSFSPVAGISSVVREIVDYLQEAHEYYTSSALVVLSSSIEKIIAPGPEKQKQVVWKFFTDYKAELMRHFDYEETEVLPYIKSLLSGERRRDVCIDDFEDGHFNIEEKLSDLRNILRSSFPVQDESDEKLFAFMARLGKDLSRHSYVEDEVMLPLVRLLEKMPPSLTNAHPRRENSSVQEELSEREKEILRGVAEGLMNKEIADRYDISINTVITHRKNISRKTGIKTTSGLTAYAILNNLIDINSVV